MAKKKKASTYTSARNLPCIGIWNRTASHEPTAGNTLVGLWQDGDGADRIEFFCAFYENAEGEGIDPDDIGTDEDGFSEYYKITYRSRQGGNTEFWDEDIDPPDYWAECRLLIPAF
jgi:hypothetical protein